MKILQLCRKLPYPLKDGEAIAVTNLARAYYELGHELTLLSFNTIKTYFDTDQLPASFNHYASIHTVYLDNRVTIKGAFLNLFSPDPYHITRFISSEFKDKLKQLLVADSFDVIQLEGVHLSVYIPIIRQYSDAKIVMRAHNVAFEIWERVTTTTSFLPKKWYLQYTTKGLKKYEIAQLSQYDLLLTMTQRDSEHFQQLGNPKKTMVVPIGLNLSCYKDAPTAILPPFSISFIGSLDWMPNQDGLNWFLEKVWNVVAQKHPQLKFHIAGRNPPEWLMNKNDDNVVVHGEVEGAKAFILEHPITVVPLFSGSGMRVKILESMALGRIVLTTTIGLEGINAKHGEEVLVANTADEFEQLIAYCLAFPEKTMTIATKAQAFVAAHYDYIKIGEKVILALK